MFQIKAFDMNAINIVTCRPVARRRSRDRWLYSGRCYAAAHKQHKMNRVYCAVR
jgi:hypothetical protein